MPSRRTPAPGVAITAGNGPSPGGTRYQQISRLPDADSHLRRLQQEYDRLIEMVQAWGDSRQRWADARANQLLQQWERAQIRRSCLELRQRLLEQRRDWELLLARLT